MRTPLVCVVLPLVVVGALSLAGCSSDDESLAEAPVVEPTSSGPAEAPADSPADSSGSGQSPLAPSGPSLPATRSPSADVGESPAVTQAPPAPTPTPKPSASATRTGANEGLRSARADVSSIAPQLESYYTEREYPADLQQVLTTLDGAGVTLSAGNRVGGYTLNANGVEFVLCIQHDGGGWASYDTAPMTVQQSSPTGACP